MRGGTPCGEALLPRLPPSTRRPKVASRLRAGANGPILLLSVQPACLPACLPALPPAARDEDMLVLFWVVGRLPRSSTCDRPSSSSQPKQNTKRCVMDGLAELGSFPSQMARGGHGIRGRVVGPGCRITRASEVWCQLQSGAECMLHRGGPS